MIPGKLLKKAFDQGLLREMIGFVAQSMMGLEMAGLIHARRTDLGLFSRRCFWLSVPVKRRGTASSSMFDTPLIGTNLRLSVALSGSSCEKRVGSWLPELSDIMAVGGVRRCFALDWTPRPRSSWRTLRRVWLPTAALPYGGDRRSLWSDPGFPLA
jgi:hypothetical protein